MSIQKLSDNMKKVLCGYSYYPELNAKMLSKKIFINSSSISTALARLKERKFFRKKYIPNFFHIQNFNVVIASGKYRYKFPEDIRQSINNFIINQATPFFSITDNISWLVIGILPNELSNHINNNAYMNNGKYMNEMTFDINKTLFSSDDTRIWRYFNYSPLLNSTFEIGVTPDVESYPGSFSIDILKNNELNVLKSLVENSKPSDYHRSQIMGISHPSISKIKKSLLERGILKSVVIPDLDVLEFSTFAWFRIKLNGRGIDEHLIKKLCIYPNNILSVYNNENLFILSIFQNMNDLMRGQQKVDEFMSNASISYEDIIFNYFSINHPDFELSSNAYPAIEQITGGSSKMAMQDKNIMRECHLTDLLKKYFPPAEATKIINEISNILEISSTNRSPEKTMSMVLELLTEPKYLGSLDETRRSVLQTKLIGELNNIRANIQRLSSTGGLKIDKSVMIVEDSKAMVEILKDMFNGVDYNISGVVDNGVDACELYKKLDKNNNRPDIILMDVFLKGLDGIEATKIIKEYDPKSSIVVLTSSLDRKIREKMAMLDVDEYLVKPITKAQLIECLDHVIIRKRGHTY